MAVSAVRAALSGASVPTELFTHRCQVNSRQVRLLGETEINPGAKLAVSSLTVPAAIDARIEARANPRPLEELPPVLARAEVQLDGAGARAALYELRKRAELKLAAFGLGHYMVAIVENDGAADVTIVPCLPDSAPRARTTRAPSPSFADRAAVAAVTAPLTAGVGGALTPPGSGGVRRV